MRVDELDDANIKLLSDPAISIQAFGWVMGQEFEEPVRYDPEAITHRLQSTIMAYASDPPIENDYTQWLVILKYRQAGSSTSACLSFYPKAQYLEGWEHATVADNKDRADYLFERVMFNHSRWPDDIRIDQPVTSETRQLTWHHGGKMRVLGGRGAGIGIGRSVSSLVASELPLWKDAARQFNYLFPAMINRRRCQVILESTPFPMDEPSAEWYKSLCFSAARGRSRLKYAFFPFWDGKLNARPWNDSWKLSIEEQRIMDKYHPDGMRLEHLAYRRHVMDTDPEIVDNPELFFVFYPPDDIICWQQNARATFRWDLVRLAQGDPLYQWHPTDEYREYFPPNPDSLYAIVVDPSGHGTRDHAAFHVFEVWAGEWRQVACYSSTAEPDVVALKLRDVGLRYNRAVIAAERNGVGTAITTALQLLKYPNIWVDSKMLPGLHKTSEDELVSLTKSALRQQYIIHDKDTLLQLRDYQNDRIVQATPKQVVLGRDLGKRKRHHWDKVSALMVASKILPTLPQRAKPEATQGGIIVPMPGLTLEYLDSVAEANKRRQQRKTRRARSRYRHRRRRK